MSSADISGDQNLSLHDFLLKHSTLPTDPAEKQAAEAAIAQLSPNTTVGALLGISSTVAENPGQTWENGAFRALALCPGTCERRKASKDQSSSPRALYRCL
jgi:hypothetical protein